MKYVVKEKDEMGTWYLTEEDAIGCYGETLKDAVRLSAVRALAAIETLSELEDGSKFYICPVVTK